MSVLDLYCGVKRSEKKGQSRTAGGGLRQFSVMGQ